MSVTRQDGFDCPAWLMNNQTKDLSCRRARAVKGCVADNAVTYALDQILAALRQRTIEISHQLFWIHTLHTSGSSLHGVVAHTCPLAWKYCAPGIVENRNQVTLSFPM